MIELPTLYDHQSDVRDKGWKALARHRGVILCGKPGFGKTRLAKHIIAMKMNRTPSNRQSGNSLFTVHRRGLVENASDSFRESPLLPHGLIMSGKDTNWKHRTHVASIDTMLSWYCVDGQYKSDYTFDLVVFDECHAHLSKFKKWLEPHDKKRESLGLNKTFIIGTSATPMAKGLADVFGEIIIGPTTEWLIQNNYLSPFQYYGGQQGNLGLLVRRGTEFTADSVSAAMDGLSGDLVRDWFQFGQGRPTVGFFPRRAHARDGMEQLVAAGVKAEYVDGNTDDKTRRRRFLQLGDGTIDYLCNVGIVERGTNIPEISCIQMCTAVGLVRWHQMLGRGSRTSDGKLNCVVIDHGGNVKRNGYFEDEIDWTLDVSKNPVKDHEPRVTIKCPRCKVLYRGGRCSNCGYEPTVKERESQGLVFRGDDLVELKKHVKKRKKKTCEQIMITALYQSGRSGRTWRQALGIAYQAAERQGTKFRVPKQVTIGGRKVDMLPYGSPDANRRVKHLFPFTVRKG